MGASTGPQFIHVAGTNGKGSTTAYVQSMLVQAGLRTGAFFSPFVVDPRERVQFGRELIPPADLAALTDELLPIAEAFSETGFGGITEFEFKTALGFLYWKRKRCEWVALEVGLGGRLDATSVVQSRASIIVSIGLDHMQILGDTVEKIAFEKAGIIQAGVPVMVGQMPEAALHVIEAVATELNAPIWRFGQEISVTEGPDGYTVRTPLGEVSGLKPGIPGAMQEHNMALAVAAIQASGAPVGLDAIVSGVHLANVPGRMQSVCYQNRTVILDGAHNPDAAKVLRSSLLPLLKGEGKVVLVTNMVQGHEPHDFYNVLTELVKAAFVVPIDFHRARTVEETVKELRAFVPHVEGYQTMEAGLVAACASADPQDLVVVTGSFYLVGDALRKIASSY